MSSDNGDFSATIPSIEIGSFVALPSDNSQFIGSASGVFFVNTVFRTFARLTGDVSSAIATTDVDASLSNISISSHTPGSSSNPELESARTWPHPADDPATEEPLVSGPAATPDSHVGGSGGVPSYGVSVHGLGMAPSAEIAGELLTRYFSRFHLLFPFLHGPTFFGQVQAFYEGTGGDLDLRARMCRAVTFQCVFHIGDRSSDAPRLESQSLIHSSATLANLVGFIASGHDIASLQALLAIELFHLTNMSLRAASIVHGLLVRVVYHAGLHRCPFRYPSLPDHQRDMRKRIFWVTYTLDRTLSQALGHPLGIPDRDIDVCIPGTAERHRPAPPPESEMGDALSPEEQAQAHLPRPVSENDDDPEGRPPELIFGEIVKHARLVGEAIELLHGSIHNRSISRAKLADLISRVHEWWNAFPAELANHPERPQARFSLIYNHLLIILNRPFLSLPTDRLDFKTSMNASVSASRGIVDLLKLSTKDGLLKASPSALAITWMAGLVLAFASLLGFYPFPKAKIDLDCCIKILGIMGTRWASARQCQAALSVLLDKLRMRRQQPASTVLVSQKHRAPEEEDDGHQKRRRVEPDLFDILLPGAMTDFPSFIPVMQYNGPDFGFDMTFESGDGAMQTTVPESWGFDSNGLFGDTGWDAFLSGFSESGPWDQFDQ